jgi:hypothetical protein
VEELQVRNRPCPTLSRAFLSGYLGYNVSYYRKHFVIPSDWKGSFIELEIEGALSVR